VELMVGAGLKALTVPALADVLSGRVTATEVRQVELEDLLGREPVLLDDSRAQSSSWPRNQCS
jgi:FlaA1/EpsC-like NDP-sugar epimerase